MLSYIRNLLCSKEDYKAEGDKKDGFKRSTLFPVLRRRLFDGRKIERVQCKKHGCLYQNFTIFGGFKK